MASELHRTPQGWRHAERPVAERWRPYPEEKPSRYDPRIPPEVKPLEDAHAW